MTLIGKACLCGHDVLQHYPEGCISCRDRKGMFHPIDWRHPFRARRPHTPLTG